MAEKVTEMKLKVDLQCPCCYKKVKKILCKFPQIRDQVYDEKNNIVKIIVVCCSPEKIRDKLCYKGGKVIKSIEIVEPPPPPKPKPKEEDKKDGKKDEEKPKPKPIEPEKPKQKPIEPEKPPKKSEKPKPEKPIEVSKPAPESAPKAPEPGPTPPPPEPVLVHPQPFPIGVCCPQCYEWHPGGLCYQEGYVYGRPVPPPPCYDNYGYPYGYSYNRGFYVSENPSACSIM